MKVLNNRTVLPITSTEFQGLHSLKFLLNYPKFPTRTEQVNYLLLHIMFWWQDLLHLSWFFSNSSFNVKSGLSTTTTFCETWTSTLSALSILFLIKDTGLCFAECTSTDILFCMCFPWIQSLISTMTAASDWLISFFLAEKLSSWSR